MVRVASHRQGAQELKTVCCEKEARNNDVTRGMVIGMICGFIVAVAALAGLSLLTGLQVGVAEGPSEPPEVTSNLSNARLVPATDVIAVSPLSVVKDASKPVGPELMARAPDNPQLWSGRLEVVGIAFPDFAAAPQQTIPRKVSTTPREKGVVIGNARMAPFYRKIPTPVAGVVPNEGPASSLTSFAADINRKRKNSETGAAKDQPLRNNTSGTKPALVRFSEPLDIDPDKPKMSIILLDDGAHNVDLDILEAFPYPITFALDASWKGAAVAMKSYRRRGFEVMVLAEFADEVKPDTARKILQNDLRKLPQAVAVMEARQGGVQASLSVSDRITRLLRATGHGLVLFPTPLNAARTLAQKSGVPAATIFRDFDGKGQSARVIRKFLDQATRKARSDGSVIMIGRVRSETIKALVLWGLQNRVNHVALAPISTVLQTEGLQ